MFDSLRSLNQFSAVVTCAIALLLGSGLAAQSPIAERISKSGLSIYDPVGSASDLYIKNKDLEKLLDESLRGMNADFKIRTRAKVVRQAICKSLGYPIPESFKMTRPRFKGQNFDCYVQKSNNLQIWNEELDPKRRYVIVKLDNDSRIQKVKVVDGVQLQKFEATGRLTSKFQARPKSEVAKSGLYSMDSIDLNQFKNQLPKLKPISVVYKELSKLIGAQFRNQGKDQERNRGETLHRMVCQQLGVDFADDGSIPDIKSQLLEVKLQTSPTIDLGMASPSSHQHVPDCPDEIRFCDLRYAIFFASEQDGVLTLKHLILVRGQQFFDVFEQLKGQTINKKMQIKLPRQFFGDPEQVIDRKNPAKR